MKPSLFVLVHGAWHDAWCWERLTPLLQNQGHTVLTPSLPTQTDRVIGLADYVESIVELVKNQPEPVILVGHSMAGLIISQVAEQVPENIHRLVYVAAYVPKHGESLVSIADQATSRGVSPYLVVDQAQSEIRLRQDPALVKLFFGECEPDDQAWAIEQLSTQPLKPFVDTVRLTRRFSAVKKTAIICANDLAILPEDQLRMVDGVVDDIISLQADHSPFLSMPDRLAQALLKKK